MKTHLIKKIPNLTDEQKKTLIELFKQKPHIEKTVYVDWSRYQTLTWSDFQEALFYRSTTELKREAAQNGIQSLKIDSDYKVFKANISDENFVGAYIPLSFEISKIIASKSIGGSVGAWCTAYQKTKNYWTDYLIRGEDVMIYVIYKHTKYAITVYPGNRHIDIHNAEDKEVETMEGLSKRELLKMIQQDEAKINDARSFILGAIPQIERDGGFIGVDYSINNDGSVDVYGNVNISDRGLENIPIVYSYVQGNFVCSNNKIASLKGAPQKVDGDFICRKNRLTDLQGGPEIVHGNYECSDNDITNLLGAPKRIDKLFSCRNNKLTHLKNLPSFIAGDVDLSKNSGDFTTAYVRDISAVGQNIYL